MATDFLARPSFQAKSPRKTSNTAAVSHDSCPSPPSLANSTRVVKIRRSRLFQSPLRRQERFIQVTVVSKLKAHAKRAMLNVLAIARCCTAVLESEGVQGRPTSLQIQVFLDRVIQVLGSKPKSLITDRGKQFDCASFRAWKRARRIRQRFGKVAKKGSVLPLAQERVHASHLGAARWRWPSPRTDGLRRVVQRASSTHRTR